MKKIDGEVKISVFFVEKYRKKVRCDSKCDTRSIALRDVPVASRPSTFHSATTAGGRRAAGATTFEGRPPLDGDAVGVKGDRANPKPCGYLQNTTAHFLCATITYHIIGDLPFDFLIKP